MNLRLWRPWISLVSTLLVLVALWVLVAGILTHIRLSDEQKIANIDPRYARLAGLLNASGGIKQALGAQSKALSKIVYPNAQGLDRLGADLQQKLRSKAAGAGARVVGSQVVVPPPGDKVQWGYIEVNLTLNGSLAEIKNALIAISTLRPVVYPEDVQVQPVIRGRDTNSQEVTAKLRFQAMYLRGPAE